MDEHPDPVLRPRTVAAAAYGFYMVAGSAFLFLASEGLRDLLGPVSFVLWNGLLMVGGGLGVFGALTKKHGIEIIGIPGVFSALAALTVFIGGASFTADAPGIVIGFAAICGGASVGTLGRGIEVYRIIRVTDRWKRVIRRERRERG